MLNKLDMLVITLQGVAGRLGDSLEERQEGATAVEYGLMVALISVAIIATVALLGGELNRLFTRVLTQLQGIA
jgi:pilus assembly protein Flp/PilA